MRPFRWRKPKPSRRARPSIRCAPSSVVYSIPAGTRSHSYEIHSSVPRQKDSCWAESTTTTTTGPTTKTRTTPRSTKPTSSPSTWRVDSYHRKSLPMICSLETTSTCSPRRVKCGRKNDTDCLVTTSVIATPSSDWTRTDAFEGGCVHLL